MSDRARTCARRWRGDRIDVLVNAAGFIRPASLAAPDDEADRNWDAVIAGNLTGAFLMAHAAVFPRGAAVPAFDSAASGFCNDYASILREHCESESNHAA